MTRPKIWNVKGVSARARAAARKSSEHSGLPIGAWIDQAIRDTTDQTDKTPDMSDSEIDKNDEPSAESEIIRVLENLESRIDEHANRISEQLAPVQDSVAGLEARIQQLEQSLDEPAEDPAKVDSGEIDTGEGEVDVPPTDSDDGEAADGESVQTDPEDGPRLELISDEHLFETDHLSDEDMNVADQSVRTDLEGLFDDGAHAGAENDTIADGMMPPPHRAERSRPLYLLVIAFLFVAAGIGIATFVWLELASPDLPEPAVVENDGESEPPNTPSDPAAGQPPAPPAPPKSNVPTETAEARADVSGKLSEPKLATAAPAPEKEPAPAESAPASGQTDLAAISALDALRNAAAAGDASAQNDLAIRYLVGRGVQQDYREAAKWLQEAGASNVTSAQYNLGVLYDSGRGVEVDPVEALIWFHSAAEKGHGRAQYALAAAYAAGRGIARDQDMALKWLRRAAQSNILEAQSSLANILATSPGSRDGLTESYFWYRVADANGDAKAADRGDQVAARLTPEERADVNRRASKFIADNIVGKRPTLPTRPKPAAASASPPPAPTQTDTKAIETPASGNPRIRQIQTLLSALGFRPGPADGAMGKQTRDAIREYQRELGLDVDGEPSAELLAHLRQLSGISE